MRTIRRSVYIGLGGTGIKAIAHVKKMYEDVFGYDIPRQIAFVAIDFDKHIVIDRSHPTSIDVNFITLLHLKPQTEYFAAKEQTDCSCPS